MTILNVKTICCRPGATLPPVDEKEFEALDRQEAKPARIDAARKKGLERIRGLRGKEKLSALAGFEADIAEMESEE